MQQCTRRSLSSHAVPTVSSDKVCAMIVCMCAVLDQKAPSYFVHVTWKWTACSVVICSKFTSHNDIWRFSAVVALSSHERSCSTLSPVSTGMGDRLWAGIPPWYVIKPTMSIQPCIPLGSLNWVPALIGWGKGGNVTSAGWQVTLCNPIWHLAALVARTAIRFFTFTFYIAH